MDTNAGKNSSCCAAGSKAHLIVDRKDCSIENLQLFNVFLSYVVEGDLQLSRHRLTQQAISKRFAANLGLLAAAQFQIVHHKRNFLAQRFCQQLRLSSVQKSTQR